MPKTEVIVLLDRSGSMQSRKADHEGGLRSFVEDQKKLDGECLFTFIQFDSENPCDVVYDGVPIQEVKDISLVPRGGTPLLDAVGLTITRLDGRLGSGKLEDTFAVLLIITDGGENESRQFSKEQIQKLIKDREALNWKVLYLGANVDAFSEAGRIGLSASNAANFDADAAPRAYANFTKKMRSSREQYTSGGIVLSAANSLMSYTDEDREEISGKSEPPTQEPKPWTSTSSP